MTKSKKSLWLLSTLAVAGVLTASAYAVSDRFVPAVTLEFHDNIPVSGYLSEVEMDAVLLYRPKSYSFSLDQIARVIPLDVDDKRKQAIQAARIRDVNRLIDHRKAAYKPYQEKALALLESGNYHALETLARDAWENATRTVAGDWLANAFYTAFRKGVGKRDVPGMERRRQLAENWLAARPDSAYAMTALLRLSMDVGWAYRGSGYNYKVANKDKAGTKFWMDEARKIAARLVQRSDLDSAMLNQVMNVSSSIESEGLPGSARYQSSVFALAARSAKLAPEFHHVFLTAVRRTLPRWGGSPAQMDALLRRVTRDLPNERRAETYYRMVNSILVNNGSREYVKYDFDWEVLNTGYQAMSKRWPDFDKNRHEFAALAYLHGKPLLAKRELQDAYPGWNHVAKDVWLYPEAMLAVQNWTTDAARAKGAVPADLALISGLRAVGSTDIAGMMAFVQKGGDVDAHDETGRSLLQHAVKNKNPTMTYALISAGADVEQSNSKGWQPVHHAAKTGSASILYMLQKAGAALDARTKAGDTPLNVAANHSNRKAFRWLLKQAPHTVNEAGDKGYTPLLHVAYDGHDDMVETLLAVDGIELNAKTHYGETALHQAARRGNAGVVRQLLAAGADARILNGRSNSVLAVAKQSGNQALVELLQQQGLVLVSGVSDDAAEQSRKFMVEANRLYSDGEFIEATRVYRKAIDTYPRSKVAHIGLGLSLFMEKKHKPALRSIQTAIEIDPQDAELYYKAGRFAFMLGERALYMDYFARYLKMAPDTYNAKDLLRRLPELAS